MSLRQMISFKLSCARLLKLVDAVHLSPFRLLPRLARVVLKIPLNMVEKGYGQLASYLFHSLEKCGRSEKKTPFLN